MVLSQLLWGVPGLSANALILPNLAMAYSVRRAIPSYTGSAMRVRRSSDNAELNIGFIGDNLDTSALITFVGAGDGFVTTWYDQSGNARDVSQPTTTQQPQIVAAGVLITNSKGRAGVRFSNAANITLFSSSIPSIGFNNLSSIITHTPNVSAVADVGHNTLYNLRTTQPRNIFVGISTPLLTGEKTAIGRGDPDFSRFGCSTTEWSANQTLVSEFYNTGKIVYYNNAIQPNDLTSNYDITQDYSPEGTFSSTPFNLYLGNTIAVNANYKGIISEAIFTNNHNIDSRVNNYTNTYNYYA